MDSFSASSCTVGERPCSWESSAVAVVRASRSSWSRRGTRTAQPLSRKCRLISPTTVGVAYVENSTPRSGSKRSTDLISPMVATWVRSSSGSPRLRKRRARCSTSGRCMRTSRLRSSAYSGLSFASVRSSANRRRAPLRSCGSCRVPCVPRAPGAWPSACRSCSLIVPPVALSRARASARAGRTGVPPVRCPPPGTTASGEVSSSGCGRACSGMPSMPSAVRRTSFGERVPSAGSSRVPRSSSRTGPSPSPSLTSARVPRRAVCRG